jgi:hypothetical protein
MAQFKPTVKVAMAAPSTLYARLGTDKHYLVAIEGDGGYRAYFRLDATKAAVVRKVQGASAQAWMRDASALLGETLTMRVSPYRMKVGSFAGALRGESYAEDVMYAYYTEADSPLVAAVEAVAS